jgi:hypothetical protein
MKKLLIKMAKVRVTRLRHLLMVLMFGFMVWALSIYSVNKIVNAQCTACGQVGSCVWDAQSGGWVYASVDCGGCGQSACMPHYIEPASVPDNSTEEEQ